MALKLRVETGCSVDLCGSYWGTSTKPIKVRSAWIIYTPANDNVRERYQKTVFRAFYYHNRLIGVKEDLPGSEATIVLAEDEALADEKRASAAVLRAFKGSYREIPYNTASHETLLACYDKAMERAYAEMRRMEDENDYERWPDEEEVTT